MSQTTPIILRVALDIPLRRLFDYLPPTNVDCSVFVPGLRLSVPFGNKNKVGILIETATTSTFALDKLKPINHHLETTPVFSTSLLTLLQWVAHYYHHPLGEVLLNALPKKLRSLDDYKPTIHYRYTLTHHGRLYLEQIKKNAHKQLKLFKLLSHASQGLLEPELSANGFSHSFYRVFIEQGYIKEEVSKNPAMLSSPAKTIRLSEEQLNVADEVMASFQQFSPFLLEGVTGSGKTEVYLQCINQCIQQQKQALVLVPEISLTPQTIARFREHLSCPILLMHSGLNDQERFDAWFSCHEPSPSVVIGTRSAVFAPLPNLGLIIIDEEHDSAFKQQDGLRYHARDVAIKRAHHHNIPIILGSATPALETLYNAQQKKYRHLKLQQRYNQTPLPRIQLIDLKNQSNDNGLSSTLIKKIEAHLKLDQQVLLFINRRGFAPTLICDECCWIASCDRCDARYTYHRHENRLRCHHCQAERIVPSTCPDCQHDSLLPLGQGTQRVEETLAKYFPNTPTTRIDRDSTRRKGSLESAINSIKNSGAHILIGTQMLAKGHNFPKLSLVGILDADSALFSSDYTASEKLGQTLIQVAGRAGRANLSGEVLLQTRHIDHPYFFSLIRQDYPAFSQSLLSERQAIGLPPYCFAAILRVQAHEKSLAQTLLESLAHNLSSLAKSDVHILGPIAANMAKIQGRYRLQLLFQSQNRARLHQLLNATIDWLANNKQTQKVRWSLDVDPKDIG